MRWTNRLPTAELAGPAARLTLDEMATSMGFVVGKLGKAPDGSRVAIELTGPLARTIRVVVDGRASWWTTSADNNRRPRFGRTACCSPGWPADEPDAAGGVELSGDQEVAARIVEHLNYTI